MGFSQQANLLQGPFQNPVNSSDLMQLPVWYRLHIQGFIPATIYLTGVGLGLVTFGLSDPLLLILIVRNATHERTRCRGLALLSTTET